MSKIAVVQLANYGDVILSTSLFRAIKEQTDWETHLITTKVCYPAISNNPDIDHVEQLDISKADALGAFDGVFKEAKSRFDRVITPWAGKLEPKDWKLLHGHVGPRNFMWSVPRCIQKLGLKYTKLVNYIYPTAAEWDNVTKTVLRYGRYWRNVLLEVETLSKQSQLKPDWLPEMFSAITKKWGKDTAFWISIGKEPEYLKELQKNFNVFSLSEASIREVALTVDYCDAFLSVSSGTANACHHQHRKNSPIWLEAVNNMDWCTMPYGGKNKHVYLGKNVSGYVDLINKVIR